MVHYGLGRGVKVNPFSGVIVYIPGDGDDSKDHNYNYTEYISPISLQSFIS